MREAPLCRFWELYEAWVLRTLVLEISAHLGAEPSQPPSLLGWADRGGPAPRPTWWANWVTPKREIDLWAQIRISASGPTIFRPPGFGSVPTAPLPDAVSVTSDLIPDAIVRSRSSRRLAMTSVVDAKQRTGTGMLASDAGAAGSKYLWGLRRPRARGAPAPDAVVLLTPLNAPAMHDPSEARISVFSAYPSRDFPRPAVEMITTS